MAVIYKVIFENCVATVVALMLTVLISWIYRSFKEKAYLPPGPTPLPLIGNVHLFLRDKRARVLAKLAKTYGDIFTIYLFNLRIVVINSHEDIKEALSRYDFSGRFDSSHLVEGVFIKNTGVVTSVGEVWRTNRRFCLKHLGDLGFGKRSLEPVIMQEAGCLLQGIAYNGDRKFDISDLLTRCVSNVTCNLIFGKRYEHDDEIFLKLIEASEALAEIPTYAILNHWIKYVPILRNEVGRIIQAWKSLDEIVDKHLREHENKDTKGDVTDLIDAFLEERMTMSDSQKAADRSVAQNIYLRKTLVDLLFAGTETTTSTLRWALLYLTKFPGVQKKLRAEIHKVVGIGRKPSLCDKSEMVYTQAFLAEVQRLPPLAPFALPHTTLCDLTFKNYVIPTETIVLPHIYAVHMDERRFPNPEEFHPERFLDYHTGKFKKSLADFTMPFSTGKRVCLGESLARMELFLFLSTMVQSFEFYTPSEELVEVVGTSGLLNVPKPFKIFARKATY